MKINFLEFVGLMAISFCATATAEPVNKHPVIEGFRNPPADCALQCWWHWVDNCVTREGISRDLKAMAEAGISTAHVFAPKLTKLPETAPIMSPAWLDLVTHAIAEAKDNGIRLGFHNCPGWSSSGGPWIRPEDSMKVVVAAKTDVNIATLKSGKRLQLPSLPSKRNFSRELATYAFPIAETPAIVAGSVPDSLPLGKQDSATIELTYANDFLPKTAALDIPLSDFYMNVEVSAKVDGIWQSRGKKAYRCFRAGEDVRTFALTGNSPSRTWKWTFTAVPTPPWVRRRDIPLNSLALGEWSFAEGGTTAIQTADLVTLDSIVKDGSLSTDDLKHLLAERQQKTWRILRIGYTTKGVGPAPTSVGGLECDKLSRTGIETHWRNMPAKILALPCAKGTVSAMIIDSYEVGAQNWTENLPQEFAKRTGHPLGGFLVSLVGYAYDTRERTRSFQTEMKKVISDLMAENYYDRFAELCHDAGVLAITEPYGGPFDTIRAARLSDVPTTEFWLGRPFGKHVDELISAARIHHKNVIAAEAFTTEAKEGRWQITPTELRASGDAAWMAGINQIVLHSYVHQPYVDRAPGVSLQRHGTQLNVNTTWWPEMRAWTDYVRRGQFLLQYGVHDRDLVRIADGRLETRIRRGPQGERVWFIRNITREPIDEYVRLSARTNDGGCELDAVDGSIFAAESIGELTRVRLNPGESRFFAFRVGSAPTVRTTVGEPISDLSSDWSITSFSGLEPPTAPQNLAALTLWNESADERLKHFAGRARYVRIGDFPAGVLDLGEVHELANVWVDGRRIGTVWNAPYRIAVPAGHTLELDVINTWPNRLIGDAVREKRGEKPFTWSNWRGWAASEQLRKAGLKGPVKIHATTTEPPATIIVRPDRATATYRLDETAQLTITVTDLVGTTLTHGRMTVTATGTGWLHQDVDLAKENPFHITVARSTPGFVQLAFTIPERNIRQTYGVAFAPEQLTGTHAITSDKRGTLSWSFTASKSVDTSPLRIVFNRLPTQRTQADEGRLDVMVGDNPVRDADLQKLAHEVERLITDGKCRADDITCSGNSWGADAAIRFMALSDRVTRGVLYVPHVSTAALTAAPKVKCPLRVVVGYGDDEASPTEATTLFNACGATDRQLLSGANMGHDVAGGFVELMDVWERVGTTSGASYRFLAFNIWGEYFGNPAYERAQQEAEIITGWQPDLVALQEMTPGFWTSALTEGLKHDYTIIGKDLGNGGTTSYVALAYRTSRLTAMDTGGELLCRELDPSKALVWAALEDRVSKKRILAFATHLWWKSGKSDDWIRLQNAKQIVARMHELAVRYNAAIVGGGDINAPVESWAMRHFIDNGLADAQLTADISPRFVPSNHRDPWRDAAGVYFGLPAIRGIAPKTSTIDHIFYDTTRLHAKRFNIDITPKACAVSDHHPIVLDFRVR